jgi:hypothetical protein
MYFQNYARQRCVEPSLEKALRRYKGVKSKLPKQVQNNHKKVSRRNQTYTEKRNAIRQELYGEASDRELDSRCFNGIGIDKFI